MSQAPRAGGPDTIFAVASGQGRAGICVIRISGPSTRGLLDRMAGGAPPGRRLSLRAIRHPEIGEVLDEAMVVFMAGPHSFTGEDQAELHLHGGVAVRRAVMQALMGLPRCRAAEPGEFTRRAFLNGRLDLTAVEGLADLIDAETEAQRRQALRQMEGTLARNAEAWRERLIAIAALLEAELDFSDEGDIPESLGAEIRLKLDGLAREVDALLGTAAQGERIRDGFTIVIAGAPNAGKSTLLNALARRDVAIVSDIPGTTRDAIEIRYDLGGLPVVFVDTAGLRETADPLEGAGIARSRQRLSDADLVLWLQDGQAGTGEPLDPLLAALPLLRIASKRDLGSAAHDVDLAISAVTGEGLDDLLARIREAAESSLTAFTGDAVLTRERHRHALAEVAAALDRAGRHVDLAVELAAEDVRLALRSLGRLTGRVDAEAILDKVFSSFCIGK